jgi:carbon monoxide dehydrogenase subunit G
MSMEIPSEFELALPPDEAYALLLDLEQVAPCMPGATLGGEREDGARDLNVTVRLGPMKFVYGGTVRIAERHDAERRAVLVGAAQESRGQGSASARITMTVSPADGGSRVESVAELDLTGRAAQTGRGIVEDVSRRMVKQMAACLAAKTAAAPEPPAAAIASPPPGGEPPAPAAPPRPAAPPEPQSIRAGSLLFSVLWDRIRRLFRRST